MLQIYYSAKNAYLCNNLLHLQTVYHMRFIKNPNITITILAIYTAIMYIYLFPRNTEMTNNEKWATVGASAIMLVALWFLLRRRNRLRKEREEDIRNNRKL